MKIFGETIKNNTSNIKPILRSSADTVKRSVLKATAVEKHFPLGSGRVDVLKGINIDINEGDFALIIGPSGCGKSTLLNTLYGLEPPTKGTVLLNGQDLYAKRDNQRAKIRRQTFGMIHQQAIWIKALRVVENIAFPLLADGSSYREALKRAQENIVSVGMETFANYRPTTLSGGQQQKISLARALINEPSIILADEPTGNLDTHSADELMMFMQNLNINQKRTIVLVTHNLTYLPYATKVIKMLDGSVVSVTEQGRNQNEPSISTSSISETPIHKSNPPDSTAKDAQ